MSEGKYESVLSKNLESITSNDLINLFKDKYEAHRWAEEAGVFLPSSKSLTLNFICDVFTGKKKYVEKEKINQESLKTFKTYKFNKK